MKSFTTAEQAAQPLRQSGYKYSHSTDSVGNVVELYDPAARNHLFEHAVESSRKVTYHEGVYYNVPSNTSVVTSLMEDTAIDPGFEVLLPKAGVRSLWCTSATRDFSFYPKPGRLAVSTHLYAPSAVKASESAKVRLIQCNHGQAINTGETRCRQAVAPRG